MYVPSLQFGSGIYKIGPARIALSVKWLLYELDDRGLITGRR
jgi:hypothetical protein